MALQKLSQSVYVGLCKKMGTPQQVVCRRDVVDVRELVVHQIWKDLKIMESGSRREGFRLHGSDLDMMLSFNDHRVLWDFSQIQHYNIDTQTLILCDTSESPPGFTLLWLPLERAGDIFLSACIRINGALYISSAKYREITRKSFTPNATEHGPCSSGRLGVLEYDDAHCFFSNFWPPLALPWIDRCHSWPPPCVLNEIISSGCHFVAIGHKLGDNVDNEWRISFSMAEQKLVYSMNHTQFLIYGLLKLFLKEIINKGLKEEEKVLCSYHIKTAIFWTIQQKTTFDWSPENLLAEFWVCFKLLLKWVYEGVCPNFFIPENNIFLSNCFRDAQTDLFFRLYKMYRQGVTFLLQSPTIRSFFMNTFCNPRLSVCIEEHTLISEAALDAHCFDEIYMKDVLAIENLNICIKYLHIIGNAIKTPLTQFQVIMLQKYTGTILQCFTFLLHNMFLKSSSQNKRNYTVDKICLHMLKLAAKCGFVSDRVYIATYLYKTLRYKDALSVLKTIKVNLAQPWVMYKSHVDPQRYHEVMGGQSLSTKMRRAVAEDVKLYCDITYIIELTPEQQSCGTLLQIPPSVLLHMLEFLCCRHVDPVNAEVALDSLQMLIHYDRGVIVPLHLRDISWEILGICQQIMGNYQAARDSYQQSLREYQFNAIQAATIHRIQDLHLLS